MADFDLVADIRGNFQDIKRQARNEKLNFDVQGQQTGGGQAGGGAAVAGGGGGRGLGGMLKLLGKIAFAVGFIASVAAVFQPITDMISGIYKILAMFLMPVMLLLMPVLGAIMKFLTNLLRMWLDLNLEDKISQLIQEFVDTAISLLNPILKAIPGLDPIKRKKAEKDDTPILGGWQRELPDMMIRAGHWLIGSPGYGDSGGGDSTKTEINVQGITNESIVNEIRYQIRTQQEENLG